MDGDFPSSFRVRSQGEAVSARADDADIEPLGIHSSHHVIQGLEPCCVPSPLTSDGLDRSDQSKVKWRQHRLIYKDAGTVSPIVLEDGIRERMDNQHGLSGQSAAPRLGMEVRF